MRILKVCKYFLTAIEKSLYGWFWACPNGNKCIYRHALPPGFVLQKDKKAAEDEEEKITLEEHVENEVRHFTTVNKRLLLSRSFDTYEFLIIIIPSDHYNCLVCNYCNGTSEIYA